MILGLVFIALDFLMSGVDPMIPTFLMMKFIILEEYALLLFWLFWVCTYAIMKILTKWKLLSQFY